MSKAPAGETMVNCETGKDGLGKPAPDGTQKLDHLLPVSLKTAAPEFSAALLNTHQLCAQSLTVGSPELGKKPESAPGCVHHLRTYGRPPGRPRQDKKAIEQELSAALETWIPAWRRTHRGDPSQARSCDHLQEQFRDLSHRTIRDIVKATHRKLGMR